MVTILDLPEEILCDIVEHIPAACPQCVLVCKQWHSQLLKLLYRDLCPSNTDSFALTVDTILADPGYFGIHVKSLDLTKVIGTLRTTRLPELMKSCPQLREFYTAQAAFTPAMMAVLPQLHHLRILDLACCIERFELSRLVNACSSLTRMHTLKYPRCAVSTRYPIKQYPPVLRVLALRGGLRDEYLLKMANKDGSTSMFEKGGGRHPEIKVEVVFVNYAPSITARPLLELLSTITTLRELTISWPIMRFSEDSLDSVLVFVTPALRYLSVSIDYITPRFFEVAHEGLQVLELKFSGVGKRRSVTADDLIDMLQDVQQDTGKHLYPNLQRLGVSTKLMVLLFDDEDSKKLLFSAAAVRSVKIFEAQDVEEVTM